MIGSFLVFLCMPAASLHRRATPRTCAWNDSTLRRYLESLVSGTAVRRTMEFIMMIDDDSRASLVYSSTTLDFCRTPTCLVFVFVFKSGALSCSSCDVRPAVGPSACLSATCEPDFIGQACSI
ncbi:hypothetical protein DE146DRAFT_504966 [Phaeosphaeria sp. MPI-PUGE-AT-0046c]|nr:hypothetical protein DE146DRAFT_504966 [Phaeosphaeria sp. MPI-PUGE-AT-0046c]